MAAISSPGLCVSGAAPIRRTRLLPVPGKLLVEIGDRVRAEDVVARADLPRPLQPVRIAAALGIPPAEVESSLVAAIGSRLEKGALIAESRALFGLLHSVVRAPFSGTIESVSKITGHAMMRPPAHPVELRAFVPGRIVDIVPRMGVVIEGEISHVQGIFGVGREAFGRLVLLDEDRQETDLRGAIAASVAPLRLVDIRRLLAADPAGIIAPSADGIDLMTLTTDALNPAATGEEDIATTIILTEGFGQIPMAARTRRLLEALDGERISVSGATQIRAGVIRPELIGPKRPQPEGAPVALSEEPHPKVRVVRGPAFGRTGTLTETPSKPQTLDCGISALVYRVTLSTGEVVTVPRPNVEILED